MKKILIQLDTDPHPSTFDAMVAFDSCVTVKHMKGVVDGFYLLFKPMTPGQHTIVLVGHDMEGVPVTLTENLTIE